MASLDQDLIPDANAEIALARSAAPASISNAADVMVLGRYGQTTAVKGSNGYLCIVERSWANATDEPDFWNPKLRAPICFNPPAARTFLPNFLKHHHCPGATIAGPWRDIAILLRYGRRRPL
jgi:hypothetical protein